MSFSLLALAFGQTLVHTAHIPIPALVKWSITNPIITSDYFGSTQCLENCTIQKIIRDPLML